MLGAIVFGVGALGFVTGFGGMYYFAFPAIVPPSSDFGSSFFSFSPPGVWDSPSRSGSSQGNLLSTGGIQVGLGYMFNLTIAQAGLDKNQSTNYWQYYMPDKTLYDVDQVAPGPLGNSPGYYFVGLMAAGAALWFIGY
jgi:hypothetical protein